MKAKCVLPQQRSTRETAIKKEQKQQMKKAICRFQQLENRVNKACDQMAAILRQVDTTQVRLNRAVARQQRHHERQLKTRLSILTNMYDVYYLYCQKKASELMLMESTGIFPPEEGASELSSAQRDVC